MQQPSLQTQWNFFENKVVPKEAGQVQRDEMKNAFMAGAAVMFQALMKLSDEESEEQANQGFNALNAEIEQHFMSKLPEWATH